jgi:hypothetical protein
MFVSWKFLTCVMIAAGQVAAHSHPHDALHSLKHSHGDAMPFCQSYIDVPKLTTTVATVYPTV